MSFNPIAFESGRVKDQQRSELREAREAILEKAKADYYKKEKQEKDALLRGETTWMHPSIEARLAKETKSKKHKKKKKKKDKKRERKSSSSSNSEDEEVWVEKEEPKNDEVQTKVKDNQDWADFGSAFGTYSRDEARAKDGIVSRKKLKEEELKKKQEAQKAGAAALELNPYYKNGGAGLPEEKEKEPSSAGFMDAAWLRKALKRAEEQAKEKGVPLEEIAAQRWGSLEKFHALLAQAEGKSLSESSKKSSLPADYIRGKRSRSRDKRRNRSRSCESRRSWDRKRSRSQDRRRSRSRDRKRSRSRDRKRSRSRDRKRSRSRDRKRSRSRDRKRSKSREKRKRSSYSRERDRSKERTSRRDRSSSSECNYKKDTKQRNKKDRSSSSSSDRSKKTQHKRERRYSSSSSSSSRERYRHSRRKHRSSSTSSSDSYKKKTTKKMLKPGETDSSMYNFSTKAEKNVNAWERTSKDVVKSGKWKKRRSPELSKSVKPKSSSSSSSSSSEDESKNSTPPSNLVEEKEEKEENQVIKSSDTSAPPVILTDKQMNELAAKLVKAELLGNETQINKLKKKLENARGARDSAGVKQNDNENKTPKEEVVLLTKTDSKGFCRPITQSEVDETSSRKKNKKFKQTHKDGKRQSYFPDDDKFSLKNMFEREKLTTADEQNSLYEKAAMSTTDKLNDDFDIDDSFMSNAALKDHSHKQQDRDRFTAIKQHRKKQEAIENCKYCIDSKQMSKHLIVSLGTKAYISLPSYTSLTDGHCLISSVDHVTCSTQADEELWEEIMNFRKTLVKMFSDRGEDCVFFETVSKLRHFPHLVIQCVPLPREVGDLAPVYFKKAIMECEAEWSVNKKLVDLKGRDVRRAVPKNMPYFFVDFAMSPGYAHVIEDEQLFPNNFAQEIIGGVLDVDVNQWRKPQKEKFDMQRKKVMQFCNLYKNYDPTQQ